MAEYSISKWKNTLWSRKTGNWATPRDFYKFLDDRFHFTLDPCPLNADFNGLDMEWSGSVYVNPVYRYTKLWVAKAFKELSDCSVIVFNIPARTDTKLFHEKILPFASEIWFIKGRLKFGTLYDEQGKNLNTSAPLPSMIVVFRPPLTERKETSWFMWYNEVGVIFNRND